MSNEWSTTDKYTVYPTGGTSDNTFDLENIEYVYEGEYELAPFDNMFDLTNPPPPNYVNVCSDFDPEKPYMFIVLVWGTMGYHQARISSTKKGALRAAIEQTGLSHRELTAADKAVCRMFLEGEDEFDTDLWINGCSMAIRAVNVE